MPVTADRELEFEVCGRQAATTALRPFDEPQETRTVVIRQPQVLQFFRVEQPVQIKMDHGNPG